MTAEAVEIPLEFRQGSPFEIVIQLFQDEAKTIPLDLTGYELNMHIREGVADSSAPLVAFLSSVASSAQDRRIFVVPIATDGTPDLSGSEDWSTGAVYLRLLSAETSAIRTAKPPKQRTFPVELPFFYDLEATPPGGQPFAVAFGPFTGTAEVTR